MIVNVRLAHVIQVLHFLQLFVQLELYFLDVCNLLHYLLLVFELLNLVTVNLLIRLESLMVPVSELSDQNSVVCLAAILK